jgi:hypothetical protein
MENMRFQSSNNINGYFLNNYTIINLLVHVLAIAMVNVGRGKPHAPRGNVTSTG